MKLSASRLAVLRECQYLARPEVTCPPDAPGPAAQTGKLFHSVVDVALSGGKPEAFEGADAVLVAKWMEAWAAWWPDYRGSLTWRSEVPYLYDFATGESVEMPRGWGGGARARGPTQLPVIVDLEAVDGDVVHVRDYKTGRRVEKARTNPQLLVAALAASRARGLPRATGGPIYVRVRSFDDTEVHAYDMLDMLEFEHEIRTLYGLVPTSEPKVGPWCFRCPVKSVCPGLYPDRTPEPPAGMFDDHVPEQW